MISNINVESFIEQENCYICMEKTCEIGIRLYPKQTDKVKLAKKYIEIIKIKKIIKNNTKYE